jgi:hypothetical protein
MRGQYKAMRLEAGKANSGVSGRAQAVEVRIGTPAHTHTVSVGAGATMVVRDRLR